MNRFSVSLGCAVGAVALSGLPMTGCGDGDQQVKAPVAQETPADSILRIGHTWSASRKDKGLMSPPSPINVFETSEESELKLEPKSAHEEVVVEETLKMRNGTRIVCRTGMSYDLSLRWGRRQGEPAVELTRPPVSVDKACDRPGHPEPRIEKPGSTTMFVLRSDSLVAVEPATDGRVYNAID